MKYRELTPKELETYQIGYKVGKQELFITDIQWENEEEHKIYRKGYLAGCKDRQRKNVNNVNNVHSDIDIVIENNSRKDVCLLDTTHARAHEKKTIEQILQEATNNTTIRKTYSCLITPDFTFPNDPFFNAYRKELPTATTRTEQWLRRSNLVGKMVSHTKLAEIIRKFIK